MKKSKDPFKEDATFHESLSKEPSGRGLDLSLSHLESLELIPKDFMIPRDMEDNPISKPFILKVHRRRGRHLNSVITPQIIELVIYFVCLFGCLHCTDTLSSLAMLSSAFPSMTLIKGSNVSTV